MLGVYILTFVVLLVLAILLFPGIRKICHDLNYKTEETCLKHRKELEKYGYIVVKQERNEHGKFARNIYTICEKPEIMESQPSPNFSGTDKNGDVKKPSRMNQGSNNNSIYKK